MNQLQHFPLAAMHFRYKGCLIKCFVVLIIMLQLKSPVNGQYSNAVKYQHYNSLTGVKQFLQPAEQNFRLTKEALTEKSRNQKTAAWTILGMGAIVLTVGIISYPDEGVTWLYSNEANRKKADKAGIITLTGTGISLASIPFFVAAKKNKRRAKLAVSSQQTSMRLPNHFKANVTGITAIFSLGK